MIRKIFSCIFLCSTLLYAEGTNIAEETPTEIEYIEPNADCLILEDEDSIVCKFEITRDTVDKQINVKWITPKGEIDRDRDLVIPSEHGSIYDYRYIDGREPGKWTFKVTFEEKEYIVNFEVN